MIIKSRPYSALRRWALARICITDWPGMSSRKMGNSERAAVASIKVGHSASWSLPFIRRPPSIWLSIEIRRLVICSLLISRDQIPTRLPDLAALNAIVSIRAVLPIPGRAAMTTSSLPMPSSMASSPLIPVGMPRTSLGCACMYST